MNHFANQTNNTATYLLGFLRSDKAPVEGSLSYVHASVIATNAI